MKQLSHIIEDVRTFIGNQDLSCAKGKQITALRFTRSEPLTDNLTNSKQLTLNLSWLDGDDCGNHSLLRQTTPKWF